ncbi:MAG: hypothetical protein V8T48_00580 [Oscillospiraceae bacterium]
MEETILKLKTENDELRRKLEHMNEIFANVQRARFGQSSEKNQLSPARAGGAAVPGKKNHPTKNWNRSCLGHPISSRNSV